MSVDLTGWKPGQWKVYTVYNVHYDAHDLYFARKDWNGKIEMATPALFTPGPSATAPWMAAATGVGDRKGILQAFLDEAWECGYRPTGFSDIANELQATRHHLSDMRAIVAKTVGAQLP